MTLHAIEGILFGEMIQIGAAHLAKNAAYVDSLNVFPVPDGDTGTNMNLSMTSGAKEARQVTENHVGHVAKAFANGLLMGARGNSGVILSQLFRGFAQSLEQIEQMNTTDFANALHAGVETAYKAVTEPVEGTILTVGRETAEAAVKLAEQYEDFVPFLEAVIESAKASLQNTPELLPVLKEVGVVDSGGQGLVIIYEGFLAKLKGEELPELKHEPAIKTAISHHKHAQDFINSEDIKYGYCTEFMVKFEDGKLSQAPFSESDFRKELGERGDSLVVVANEEVVKVHIHTEYPGDAMTLGQRYGSLINIKVENMREQHSAIVSESVKEKTPLAIITVSAGEGVNNLFKSIGAHIIIEGGQTMNPSTADIEEKIKEANANNVVILPNNKNIIMAAEQAKELATDVHVTVIPTKTIPQGIAALLSYDPDAEVSKNIDAMQTTFGEIKSAQVTYAVRDTEINGLAIQKDAFIGISEGNIIASDKDQLQVAKSLIDRILTDEDEIVTILYGEGATSEEAEAFVEYIEEICPDVEVELHEGNQPVYSYIIAVE